MSKVRPIHRGSRNNHRSQNRLSHPRTQFVVPYVSLELHLHSFFCFVQSLDTNALPPFELDGDNETLILGVFDDEFELLILGEIVKKYTRWGLEWLEQGVGFVRCSQIGELRNPTE